MILQPPVWSLLVSWLSWQWTIGNKQCAASFFHQLVPHNRSRKRSTGRLHGSPLCGFMVASKHSRQVKLVSTHTCITMTENHITTSTKHRKLGCETVRYRNKTTNNIMECIINFSSQENDSSCKRVSYKMLAQLRESYLRITQLLPAST